MERIQDVSLIETLDDISEEQYCNIAQILFGERKRLDETMKEVLVGI